MPALIVPVLAASFLGPAVRCASPGWRCWPRRCSAARARWPTASSARSGCRRRWPGRSCSCRSAWRSARWLTSLALIAAGGDDTEPTDPNAPIEQPAQTTTPAQDARDAPPAPRGGRARRPRARGRRGAPRERAERARTRRPRRERRERAERARSAASGRPTQAAPPQSRAHPRGGGTRPVGARRGASLRCRHEGLAHTPRRPAADRARGPRRRPRLLRRDVPRRTSSPSTASTTTGCRTTTRARRAASCAACTSRPTRARPS